MVISPQLPRGIPDRGHRARRMLREPTSVFCQTLEEEIMFHDNINAGQWFVRPHGRETALPRVRRRNR
jgi:hypothetical protein